MGSFDLPQVVGLVITDKGRLALLKVGARTVSVTVGEKIPGTGWEVRAIEPEGVTLVFSEGQREKVVLRPAF
jgi:type IV pilus biogenesis protein PilP